MKKFFYVLMIVMLCCACSSKEERAIKRLESFTVELKENAADYEYEDWQKASQRYDEIMKEIEQCEDFTPEQRKEILKLRGECMGYMSKAGIETAGKWLQEAVEDVGSFLEGLGNSFGSDDK